jgi:diadenosine tetraphosphate (Ap4A) HIT family hydrolase
MNARGCPFCQPQREDIVLCNDLCYARYDPYPVSPGHLLIIPYRHVSSFFDLTADERMAMLTLIDAARAVTDEGFEPDGYNIGVNVGEAAGQSVMHVHVHMIPRYTGDVRHARGGIRSVVPGKRVYPTD